MSLVKSIAEWAGPPKVVLSATADRGAMEFRDELRRFVERANKSESGVTNVGKSRLHGTVYESCALCRLHRESLLDDRLIRIALEWREVAEAGLKVYVRIWDRRNNRALALVLVPLGVCAAIYALVVARDLGVFALVSCMTAGLALICRRSYLLPSNEVVDAIQNELSEHLPCLNNWERK